jgi:hypothetical protein
MLSGLSNESCMHVPLFAAPLVSPEGLSETHRAYITDRQLASLAPELCGPKKMALSVGPKAKSTRAEAAVYHEFSSLEKDVEKLRE